MSVDSTYDSIINIDNHNSNTIDHILIGDLLDYYDNEHIINILSLIVDKISPSGYIEIQGPDISELCVASASTQIDIDTVKDVIRNRKTIHTIYDVEQMLQNLKLTINKKRYVNIFEYHILAQKHEK